MAKNDDRWLLSRLRDLATDDPDRLLFTELADGEAETESITAAQLAAQAVEVADRLVQRGAKPGDRVILFDGRTLETLMGYVGALAAGASPIVLPPPRRPEHVQSRLLPVVRDARPVAVLSGTVGDADRGVFEQLAGLIDTTVSVDDVKGGASPQDLPDQPLHPRAFLQYTSGSTATPRGVEIEHHHLMDNLTKANATFAWTAPGTVIVTWNPLSHDMGLILGALPALAYGVRVVIMPPEAFIFRPGRWLRAMTKYSGTHGYGPNFAYDLCVDRVKEPDRTDIDLSSWRVALNGAEPVREGTRQRFVEAYRPHGFDPTSWCPAYGLAESTVLVTANLPGKPPRTTWIERAGMAENRVVEVSSDAPDATAVVGCGGSEPDTEVIVVDAATRTRLDDHSIGEIWVRGGSVALGYFERPEETEKVFGLTLENGDGPWMNTGDLGFIRGGEVHPVGRVKDMLIVHGRNVHASDIELAASEAHPAIRRGGIIAFSYDAGDRERIVVVAEVNGVPDEREVGRAVREHVFTVLEVPVDKVVMAAPRSVPKTTSGKLRRSECRRMYLEHVIPAPEPVSS